MGMAASQARFLGLTARKTNTEYEGQQVNQQRTMLANKSANYYNDLLGMTVPTPPSVEDFTKTTYMFNDGALENTVNSMIAQADGKFLVSYTRTWTNDHAVVSTSSSIVNRIGSAAPYSYAVGAKPMRTLGSLSGWTQTMIENDPYLSTLSTDELNALMDEEKLYESMLNEKYGESQKGWNVIYRQDTTTKTWVPTFYSVDELSKESTLYNPETGASQSFIPAYTIGAEKEKDEVKGALARLEKDSSGRYINITLVESDGKEVTYALTTNTTTDQAAYNSAMNQYEYNKSQYDKSVQDINSKIETVRYRTESDINRNGSCNKGNRKEYTRYLQNVQRIKIEKKRTGYVNRHIRKTYTADRFLVLKNKIYNFPFNFPNDLPKSFFFD